MFSASTVATWGIGVHGRLKPHAVAELAGLAEESGYNEFWFNVVGTDVDPVPHLSHALANTQQMGIGVGVIPLDIHPVETWAVRMADEEIDSPRVTIGVGAGVAPRHQLRLVSTAVDAIRAHLPHTRVGVGASGPRMLELTARLADAVVFSMLAPEKVRTAVTTLLAAAPNPQFAPYVYHRVAAGPDAERLLLEEMAANGVDVNPTNSGRARPPLLGSLSDNAEHLAELIRQCHYPAVARVILRPVVDWDDMAQIRTALRRLSPRGNDLARA